MDEPQHISVAKDEWIAAALEKAASLNEPGTSEAELLRYVALVGAENLPPPYVPPTPEQIQRSIGLWTGLTPPEVLELIDGLDTFPDPHEPRSRSDAG